MTKECPFEAWQLIQAREILQWLTEGKAMSLGKQTILERIEDILFNIAYEKLGLKPIGKCSVEELQEEHKFKVGDKLIQNKFDPKTLKAFDRVLARIDGGDVYCWFADFVSTPTIEKYDLLPCIMSNKVANMIIPYNDDTKHLVGTTEEAPEYYRYWED